MLVKNICVPDTSLSAFAQLRNDDLWYILEIINKHVGQCSCEVTNLIEGNPHEIYDITSIERVEGYW